MFLKHSHRKNTWVQKYYKTHNLNFPGAIKKTEKTSVSNIFQQIKDCKYSTKIYFFVCWESWFRINPNTFCQLTFLLLMQSNRWQIRGNRAQQKGRSEQCSWKRIMGTKASDMSLLVQQNRLNSRCGTRSKSCYIRKKKKKKILNPPLFAQQHLHKSAWINTYCCNQ